MSIERDAWLYSTKRGREAVRKAAVDRKGLFDASSDYAYRYLAENAQERSARIVNWGASPDPKVSIHKAAGSDPPPSRQLRDPFTTFYVQGIALEPPLPPDRLLNLTEESPLHSACLMAKATDACGRGWSFEPREGKGADDEAIHSEVPEKLAAAMEDLTPDLTFTELLYQAAWEMDAIGWGVWEVVRINNDGTPGKHGEVGAIYPIPSHTIRASLDPRKWVQIRAGRVRYFKKFGAECTINNETGEVSEWKGAGKKKADEMDEAYVASELIIFKSYTPRSLWYGLPRWISCIATIAELAAIREFNVSWFASGGQVDYHIHFKAGSEEAAISIKDQADQQIRENAGRSHVKLFTAGDAETEVAVNKLGETLREGHFRFRRTDLIKEVLIGHNVPPYRIGWAETGSLGGSAADEMLGAYRLGAIKPIQQVIEDRLRVTLFDPKIGIKTDEFRFKLNDLELEDLAGELKLAQAGVESGFVTPNQAREQVGLEPDEDRPEMNEYYYRGTKLGEAQPQAGFGGGEPGGEQGNEGGGLYRDEEGHLVDGEGNFIDAQGNPVDEPVSVDEQGNIVDERGKARGKMKIKLASRRTPAGDEAKRVVIEMLTGYEAKLKAALIDTDPVDSEQPPTGKPKRGRGRHRSPTATGPARDDKPNIASKDG